MNEIEIERVLPIKRLKYLFTLNKEDKKVFLNKIKNQPQKKWRKTLRNHFNGCHYLSNRKRVDGKEYFLKW